MTAGPRSIFARERVGFGASRGAFGDVRADFGSTRGEVFVPQDGPGRWYVPETMAQSTALGLAAPRSLYPCQESAGSLIDVVSGRNLAPTGTVGYGIRLPGWDRNAAMVAANAGNRFGRNVGESPNFLTTSVLWIAYVSVVTTATIRSIMVGSDSAAATELAVRKAATDVPSIKAAAVTANGAVPIAGSVHAYALLWDITNLRAMLYTDLEKRSGTYGVILDGAKGFGAGVNGSGDLSIVWSAQWVDADAELTDAQVKALMQRLNINVPWS